MKIPYTRGRYNGPLLAAVVAAAAVLLAVAPAASATPANPGDVSIPPVFAAQSRAAGLTTSQAEELQRRINADLHDVGGTQTAANTIAVTPTEILVEPVPGEATARNLTGARAQTATPGNPAASAAPLSLSQCGPGDFCAWKSNNYTGTFLAKYKCNDPVNIPSSWLARTGSSYQGSFYNHNTGNAPGYLYSGANGTGDLQIRPAAGAHENWPWGAAPVTRSFVACK